jgi:phosphate transport system substrate-binding protein
MLVRASKNTPRFARLQRAGVATVAGALVISALSVSTAFAQTKSVAVAHKTPTIKTLEKELKALEVPAPSSTPLTETGSSLLFPLMNSIWTTKFPYLSTIPFSPVSSSSGVGQTGVLAGTVNIGGSDVYATSSQLSSGAVNIPEVVSAQMVNYNIPGLSTKVHLKLNPQLLNEIYAGTITNWDDPAIKAVNKGVKIPSVKIVPLHRTSSSGDTFIFTWYLSSGDKASFVRSDGGASQTWNQTSEPSTAEAESGNTGMLQACAVTTGCIAYIGISYENSAVTSSHLGLAQLENASDQYLLPTSSSVTAEVAAVKSLPANGVASLDYLPKAKGGYPIVNFEYAWVDPAKESSNQITAIKSLLAWGMNPTGGASAANLANVHFQALPAGAMNLAYNLLKNL